MDPDQHQREKQSVIMCAIVGDVPNSGYMLRFTQEHACLRISTKPVDMPEDSIIDSSLICIFLYKNESFWRKMRITCSQCWLYFQTFVGFRRTIYIRFTQEHAYLRTSTKPVDMPEDSVFDVSNFFFFYKIMIFFKEKWITCSQCWLYFQTFAGFRRTIYNR